MISKKDVVQWVNKHKEIIDEISPSFFEMTVAMAFDYFSRSGVDLAVIEVGMGGRLDSTNIINPLLSIITNVSLDHTEFLGDTLEKIAVEKAGIIKEKVPVLIGEERAEIIRIFEEIAEKKNSPLYSAHKIFQVPFSVTAGDGYQYFSVRQLRKPVLPELKSDLTGITQRKNLPVVLQAIEILRRNRFEIPEESIYKGIGNAAKISGLRGRWEIIGRKPLIVLDTAHNQDGIRELIKQLEETRYRELHVVFGVVGDKMIDHMLRHLPTGANYYFTRAGIPRAMDEKILGAKAAFYGLTGKIFATVNEAVEAAGKDASEDDLMLVTGSTFVVADAMQALKPG
jgi:dihydrofolate synthase/folylpolyglutamate synthase